jgi:hypothetical protein
VASDAEAGPRVARTFVRLAESIAFPLITAGDYSAGQSALSLNLFIGLPGAPPRIRGESGAEGRAYGQKPDAWRYPLQFDIIRTPMAASSITHTRGISSVFHIVKFVIGATK